MALLEINWSPEGRQLRDFGFIAAALLACLGVLIGFRHKAFGIALGAQASWTVAAALLALGAIAALLAVLAPGLLRPAYIGLTAAGLPIGYAVSHVVMAAIYFGVFTPIGLALRLVGRDPLRKGFDRQAETYWVKRTSPSDPARYFHQF